MVAILNVEQDHSTQFKVHHIQVLSNLTKWFSRKKNEKRKANEWQAASDLKSSLEPLAIVN